MDDLLGTIILFFIFGALALIAAVCFFISEHVLPWMEERRATRVRAAAAALFAQPRLQQPPDWEAREAAFRRREAELLATIAAKDTQISRLYADRRRERRLKQKYYPAYKTERLIARTVRDAMKGFPAWADSLTCISPPTPQFAYA